MTEDYQADWVSCMCPATESSLTETQVRLLQESAHHHAPEKPQRTPGAAASKGHSILENEVAFS